MKIVDEWDEFETRNITNNLVREKASPGFEQQYNYKKTQVLAERGEDGQRRYTNPAWCFIEDAELVAMRLTHGD